MTGIRQYNLSAAASFTRGESDGHSDQYFCLLVPAECMKEADSWRAGYNQAWKKRGDEARAASKAVRS